MARIFRNDFKASVRFWRTNGWTEVPLTATQMTNLGSDDLSPDGNRLMALSMTGIAHLWRAPSWEEIEVKQMEGRTP